MANKQENIKVYLYTRVSTAMQVDGYSLDAQKAKMKAFCEFNNYEIAGEYEDAGISGKSIENRIEFNHMMDDIKTGRAYAESQGRQVERRLCSLWLQAC